MSELYPATVSVERAKKASRAESQLNVFASIQAILEGGTISGSGTAEATKQKIIKLCLAEQQRQLAIFDKALGRKES